MVRSHLLTHLQKKRSTFPCQKERSPAAREKAVKGDRPFDAKRAIARRP
jgi:hypothetical protein